MHKGTQSPEPTTKVRDGLSTRIYPELLLLLLLPQNFQQIERGSLVISQGLSWVMIWPSSLSLATGKIYNTLPTPASAGHQ